MRMLAALPAPRLARSVPLLPVKHMQITGRTTIMAIIMRSMLIPGLPARWGRPHPQAVVAAAAAGPGRLEALVAPAAVPGLPVVLAAVLGGALGRCRRSRCLRGRILPAGAEVVVPAVPAGGGLPGLSGRHLLRLPLVFGAVAMILCLLGARTVVGNRRVLVLRGRLGVGSLVG